MLNTKYIDLACRTSGVLAACALLLMLGCGGAELKPWHTENLSAEFSVSKAENIRSLADYLQLEEEVFAQLDEKIYAQSVSGAAYALMRYSSGSLSDPRKRRPNWNRSFELDKADAVGGVLLLHGMSDSPYSLRALGLTLNRQGYRVLGLRLPGHGTAPSAMISISWQDMSAAVRLGMEHLRNSVGNGPVHIIGYSTGATLALDYALEAQAAEAPASLVLISPAIGLSPVAGFSGWKRRLSKLPSLGNLAWLTIEPEFDPYKYNSFATRAAEQVHLLSRSVSARIRQRSTEEVLPPILVLTSAVDATVSVDAVVDRLLMPLASNRHELVLFDINRFAPLSMLLVVDSGPITNRMLQDPSLPFSLTVVGNTDIESRSVSAFHKKPFAEQVSHVESLGLDWPEGILSLSHVSLPFPSDDPLYGRYPPEDRRVLFLGQQALQGERGLFKISPSYLLRLRHNPFYDYLEERVLDWVDRSQR